MNNTIERKLKKAIFEEDYTEIKHIVDNLTEDQIDDLSNKATLILEGLGYFEDPTPFHGNTGSMQFYGE